MKCTDCEHIFSEEDVKLEWWNSGLVIKLFCPTCCHFFTAQISLMQKPEKEGR